MKYTHLLLSPAGLVINMEVRKDPTKPDGDAVNADGTLKSADEMDWPTTPTAPAPSIPAKRSAESPTDRGEEAPGISRYT